VNQSARDCLYLLGGIIKSDNDKFKGLNYISADRRIGRETDGRVVANNILTNERKD
jgi:hypothetical protein